MQTDSLAKTDCSRPPVTFRCDRPDQDRDLLLDRSALTGNTSFYPSTQMTAEERLSFYAEHFPIVEVDSTYYAPPSERVPGSG